MTTIIVTVPAKTEMPYGAWLAATAFTKVVQLFEKLRALRR